MPRQLAFELDSPPSYGRADFLPAPANAEALAWIECWPAWPGPALALVGPPGSGKTHLLNIWSEISNALKLRPSDLERPAFASLVELLGPARRVAIDDASAVAGRPDAERLLFHLYNWLHERGGALLLAATTAPARWHLRLPDLASRLRTAVVAEIGPPDDALLEGVLVKLFHDRQVPVGEDVIRYLIPRMERSLSAARVLVRSIDAQALAGKRAVSVKLVASVLAALSGEENPAQEAGK